jgi:hypothetical protein
MMRLLGKLRESITLWRAFDIRDKLVMGLAIYIEIRNAGDARMRGCFMFLE